MRDREIIISPISPPGGKTVRISEEEIKKTAVFQGNVLKFEEKYEFQPNQEVKIKVVSDGCVSTRDRWVERVRYLTENMSIVLWFPTNIYVDGRFYHPALNEPTICMRDTAGSNPYHISISGGILPYQAIEVFWEPITRR
jgi:hypothetical protein